MVLYTYCDFPATYLPNLNTSTPYLLLKIISIFRWRVVWGTQLLTNYAWMMSYERSEIFKLLETSQAKVAKSVLLCLRGGVYRICCSPISILSSKLETLRLGDIIEQILHSLPGMSLRVIFLTETTAYWKMFNPWYNNDWLIEKERQKAQQIHSEFCVRNRAFHQLNIFQ